MDQSIAKLELSLDGKINNVIKRIDEVAASCDAIGVRQAEAESRISALEDDMTPLQARVNELIKSNSELASQVLDLQARSRRDNLRILNLRESVEGSNPVLFFEKFIPKLLHLSVSDISIDRTHRTFGPPAAADDRPRPVIIKFHRSRDVITVLSAAKRAGDLQYEDRPLRIVPDIPPAVRLIRRGFNDVCTELIKRKVRFRMAFPAVLSFEINGMKKSFTEPKRARAFLGGTVQ
uniref:LINE-1 type transposase domain-containing 1 n=1 Tax=Knipowitschia caucasica TaxID=637954 RepID=A0AAV2LZQ3_KNICA